MMFPVLQVGPLAVQMPGLILLAGLWIGLTLMEKNAAKFKIRPDIIYNLVFTALVLGLIGARLSYAGRFPGAFSQSPISLISLNPGLFDPVGGIAFAVIGAFVYGQRKDLPLWPTLDALTPLFGSLVIALALSNLSSGRGFGAETTLPWGLEIWGAFRHPSQIYEAAAGLFVIVFLWPAIKNPKKRTAGSLFLTFVILTAMAKLFLEGFRGDSTTILNGLRVAQITAWLALSAGLWGLYQHTSNSNAKQV